MSNSAPQPRSQRLVPVQVVLRPVAAADLGVLCGIQLDPEGNRMAMVHPREPEAFHAHWAKVLVDPNVVPRAIVADGELVGSISRFQREGKDFVGYWIAREQWGRGIASAALALLLKEVSIRPLHARVARENAASIRVLEKCGFRAVEWRESAGDERLVACEEGEFVLK